MTRVSESFMENEFITMLLLRNNAKIIFSHNTTQFLNKVWCKADTLILGQSHVYPIGYQ